MSPNPAKEAIIPGSLVSPVEGGVVNWPPPAYSPVTGLVHTHEKNGFNLLYLAEPDPRGSMRSAVRARADRIVGRLPDRLDRLTGETKCVYEYGPAAAATASSPAGNVIFTGDGGSNLVAVDAATANRSGIRASATHQMRQRRICWMASSTCWWRCGTSCTPTS
ncbi:MAG: hypothetical protein R2748_22310 [Bryobacterales bacterium]